MSKAKVVLVGAANSGKTSIVGRYVSGEFLSTTMPTTQPAFSQKRVNYYGKEVSLEIWDTAGQEQYHALSPLYYRDADIGIIVFDLTDQSSFIKSKQWVNELRQARGDGISMFLVGNKSDLLSIRTVSLETSHQFASSIGAEVFETSAKTGENIEMLFSSIVKSIASKDSSVMSYTPRRNRSSVKFDNVVVENKGCSC